MEARPLRVHTRFDVAPSRFAPEQGFTEVDGEDSLSPAKHALEAPLKELHSHPSRTDFRFESASRDHTEPAQPAAVVRAPGIERLEPTRGIAPTPAASAPFESDTQSEVAHDARPAERPPATPRTALFDALAKVEAWMKSPAAPAAQAVTPSIEPATPRHVEHAATDPSQAIAAPRPPPRLSIGRIDVRVLPAPAARKVAPTQRRVISRSARSPFTGPRPFGWRQR